MRLVRVALALMAVLALLLGLIGTAEAKEEKAQAHKARPIHGTVVSTPTSSSFQLQTRKGVVTVSAADSRFSIPGGKKLSGIITRAQDLRAGDEVIVRGKRTDSTTFTAKEVHLTGKTIKLFGGQASNVSSSSLTVTNDDLDVSKTFSLSGAVILPSGSSPANGDQVRVVFRKGTTNALGVLVKKS
ncbi:MAG: hypothetical protein HY690_03365 [Chloroflexi bacterium]|nr:hypothetical protein [Chloroflexota bacterium]